MESLCWEYAASKFSLPHSNLKPIFEIIWAQDIGRLGTH